MNQTTAHLAALARALGGYPSPALCREHLIPMRALPPAVARCRVHVSAPPSRVFVDAAPIRDGRFPVGLPTGRSSSRDTLCQLHAGRTRAADSTKRQPIAVTFRLMPPGIFN